MMAYKQFLQSKNYNVDIIKMPNNSYESKLWFYYQSATAHLFGHNSLARARARLMNKIADKLENKIKKERYDVVIGVETKYSFILTRDLSCLKIFSCESLETDELFFSKKKINVEHIRSYREMEIDIMMKSDYVIFPWETTENYMRKYIWNGNNFITIKYGCYPKNKTVTYFFPPLIVHLGNLRHYWANKNLLSYLTRISPYIIDVYGRYKPEHKYGLNYKGFAKSTDVFCNYQFGLNTVSKDIFRQNHFSSKVTSYLAYGLPVLFPEWQKFPKELKGCVAYNQDNFLEVIEEYSYWDRWEKINEEAIKQGRELDWNITLKPLEKLIQK